MDSVSASMGSTNIIFLTMVILFFCAASSNAQNSPEDYLAGHNAARAEVGSAPLVWDDKVAEFAKWWAANLTTDCRLEHSDEQVRQERELGECIYGGGNYGTQWTATDAVTAWVSEKPNYDYSANTCKNGTMCGHYTQVVWSGTQKLGCTREVCKSGQGVIIICSYNPPGNWIGQRPYELANAPTSSLSVNATLSVHL